jgi:circadian clock protein KaiC
MTNQVSLEKHETGVPGLDTLLCGGIPRYSFVVLTGSSGSGKTTLAHQIMFSLVKNGEKALYFSILGEPPLKMLRFQQQYSFFDIAQVGTNLKYVNLADDLQNGGYDSVLERIMTEVEGFQPTTIFIDSFKSTLLASKKKSKHGTDLQSFMHRLAVHLSTWQSTTFLMGDYVQTDPEAHPIFTLADCVIELSDEHDANATLRKLHVLKLRGSRHLQGYHSIRIDTDGLTVFPRLSASRNLDGSPPVQAASGGRLRTGISALDAMLAGGIPVGSILLVAGMPGSGKSTLATSFLEAGAKTGEHGVAVLFALSFHATRQRRLQELIAAGHVTAFSPSFLDISIDEMMAELAEVVRRTGARRLVLDSLDTLELALAPQGRHDFQEALFRALALFSERSITVVMTKSFSASQADLGNEAILADGIVSLRHIETANRMSREICVIKLRNSAHGEEIRRYRLSESGMDIEQESD